MRIDGLFYAFALALILAVVAFLARIPGIGPLLLVVVGGMASIGALNLAAEKMAELAVNLSRIREPEEKPIVLGIEIPLKG